MTNQAEKQTFIFTAPDDTQIYCHRWPVEKPSAIVQIVHGGAEHAGRYNGVAQALNEQGYTVYAEDHRGHGRTGEINTKLGDMGEANAFERVCDDVLSLGRRATTENPGVPLVIIGHSLGSLITQRILLQHSEEYAAAVLSGSPDIMGIAAGAELVHAEVDRVGRDQVSEVLDAATVENFAAAIPDAESPYDWLSRDREQVKLYADDPWCGYALCTGVWQDLIAAMLVTTEVSAVAAALRKDLPIYILSGSDDPVHADWTAIDRLAANYRDCGVQDITIKNYNGGRHEMFNEVNRDEVIAELLDWLVNTLS
ncbi:MAG: alpha/beta fold hydrolase [Haliea sp.]|jgi:alpha-beta hydrolase superfamily lysophospholipase|nr:alpha/beta fold hydrolase [Haliea sp.]